MRIMIDTNVFLDVLTRREPFYAASRQVLELCENGRVQGFLTASSVTDIYYLIHRHLHDAEQSYKALGAVLKIAKVLPVTNEDVLSAYLRRAPDFEDCLLATCAQVNHCDMIVTRNVKDFAGPGITVMSPDEFLRHIKA